MRSWALGMRSVSPMPRSLRVGTRALAPIPSRWHEVWNPHAKRKTLGKYWLGVWNTHAKKNLVLVRGLYPPCHP
jgi:hypothetical protein